MTNGKVWRIDPKAVRLMEAGLDLYQALGAHIRFHRRAQDMSQETLAEFVHMPLDVIGKIERGTTTSTVDTVERIAAALVLPPLALFGVGEDMSTYSARDKILGRITKALMAMSDEQMDRAATMLEALDKG